MAKCKSCDGRGEKFILPKGNPFAMRLPQLTQSMIKVQCFPCKGTGLAPRRKRSRKIWPAYDPTTQPYDEPFRHIESRFVNCEVCQTEGRILRNSGGPYDVDYGVCPACNGKREIEIKCEPVTASDIESGEWCGDGPWSERH